MYRRIACALLLLSASPFVFAEKGDLDKPMEIEAQYCKRDQKTGSNICTGDVVVTQDSMSVRADRLEVRQDAAGNQSASGEGKPVKFRQKWIVANGSKPSSKNAATTAARASSS